MSKKYKDIKLTNGKIKRVSSESRYQRKSAKINAVQQIVINDLNLKMMSWILKNSEVNKKPKLPPITLQLNSYNILVGLFYKMGLIRDIKRLDRTTKINWLGKTKRLETLIRSDGELDYQYRKLVSMQSRNLKELDDVIGMKTSTNCSCTSNDKCCVVLAAFISILGSIDE